MDCAVIAQPYNHVSIIRRKTLWYTIASGNWTDKNIWMSNSRRKYAFPQRGDDVEVGFGHTVTFNYPDASTVFINNLYVAGTFLLANSSTVSLHILGDLQATGTVNLTTTGSSTSINLYGVNNYISNFIAGSNAIMVYARGGGDQPVMNLNYANVTTTNGGTKYSTSNITTTGNLVVTASTVLELGSFDLVVGGVTTVSSAGTLSKNGSGSVTFIGQLSATPGPVGINFSGNPSVEFRGGIFSNVSASTINFGNGTTTFTATQSLTNNQGASQLIQFGNAVVSGAITVTVSAGLFQINNSINGTVSASTVLNKGILYFNTTTAPMVTGVFDYASFANTIGYVMNGTFTIPYSSYSSLSIGGTGIKTLGSATTLSGNLTLITTGQLQLSTFDLSVGGTTTLASGTISKSGSGNVLFIGQVTWNSGSINFSGGNPTVELRGGINSSAGAAALSSGTGTWSFTTNNQAFSGFSQNFVFDAPVLISGAITVTNNNAGASITFNNTLNGNNAASTFDNRVTANYKAAQQPMLTGVLQVNAAANTFQYNAAGNQDITGGTYRTLTLAGSGVKTLQGNVVVATAYTLTPPATLNTNGFTRS